MSFFMITPAEAAEHISKQMRKKRLSFDFSQKTLSEKSGVSFSVIKKFERTGKISLESLLKIALVLNALEDFSHLFKPVPLEEYGSIHDLLNEKKRKRGRT